MFEFKKLTETDLPLVLNWRLQPQVADYMFTEIENNLSQQQNWFKKIHQRSDCYYWLIYFANKAVGVLNLSNLDLHKQSCDWGFYIGDLTQRNIGGLVPPYFYNFLFSQTPVKTLTAEVLAHNHQVIKLHQLHGYQEQHDSRYDIEKNQNKLQVRVFELYKADWLAKKRFRRCIAEFDPLPGVI
ncbi:UDP-4-amino-4,6-dideoxy-N-acetyl-beta-L-altrosamine N-acetyltransferase [Gayadomonas joobiniege]|uniref:UDP-4-amino-4, 6-dideoxy-N-acetyl-beta-L-altrosamine N-acetyltransferase n=1 Tax=Gayadomonas joobiniege TaxID=1234606 RepID=UPI00035F5227|nr:UDP-4-amino-4,6-dideoxy-N-acetyl-beta-L-altrosamine N-acetyltransferase [Gayadomonas joobiniege]